MPKENINDVSSMPLRAEVNWKPDVDGSGYVQLATVHTDTPATMPCEHRVTVSTDDRTGLPVAVGCECGTSWSETAIRECPEEIEKGRSKLDGWHVTLDREQINRLIRVLRRARDAAFGSDA